ncbi:hypothetical protein LQW54_008692 [Pestalotiopsis sp. IQ-011]
MANETTLPDLTETRQPNLYASSTIPCAIALICVGLRVWCRRRRGAGMWFDDWLILASAACAIGLTATLFWWIPRALGKHIQTFGPNVMEDLLIADFACELTYTGVIVFVKFSILALYWRIFKMSNIKIPIGIMASLVFMWGITVFLLTLLQCIPTRGFWDKTVEADCNVDSQKFLFAISIPNILIDVALLVLPLPYVKKLNVSGNQKRAIASMFLLGGFVCLASIMRLVAVGKQPTTADMTWNVIDQAIWATVEADFAIISACLPTLRPVWISIRPKAWGTTAGSKQSSAPYASGNSRPVIRKNMTWGMSILNTRVEDDEEAIHPLSPVSPTKDAFSPLSSHSVTNDNFGNTVNVHSGPNVQEDVKQPHSWPLPS